MTGNRTVEELLEIIKEELKEGNRLKRIELIYTTGLTAKHVEKLERLVFEDKLP